MQAVDFFFFSFFSLLTPPPLLYSYLRLSPSLIHSIVNSFRYDFSVVTTAYTFFTTDSLACGATPDTSRRYTYNIFIKKQEHIHTQKQRQA
jgi:hypothetical protein